MENIRSWKSCRKRRRCSRRPASSPSQGHPEWSNLRRRAEHAFANSRRRGLREEACRLARGEAPGPVFGDQAVLLDQPHTADVKTVEQSEFYVADAPAMFVGDPTVALYVATILARRIDTANRSLIEVKHQLKAGEPPNAIGRTVEKVEELLNYSGDASLVFGTPGYWGA